MRNIKRGQLTKETQDICWSGKYLGRSADQGNPDSSWWEISRGVSWPRKHRSADQANTYLLLSLWLEVWKQFTPNPGLQVILETPGIISHLAIYHPFKVNNLCANWRLSQSLVSIEPRVGLFSNMKLSKPVNTTCSLNIIFPETCEDGGDGPGRVPCVWMVVRDRQTEPGVCLQVAQSPHCGSC